MACQEGVDQAGYKTRKDVEDQALKDLHHIAEVAEKDDFKKEIDAMFNHWNQDSRYKEFADYFTRIYLGQLPP